MVVDTYIPPHFFPHRFQIQAPVALTSTNAAIPTATPIFPLLENEELEILNDTLPPLSLSPAGEV